MIKIDEKYIQFMDMWDSLNDTEKNSSVHMIYEFFDNSAEVDEYGENVINLYQFYYAIWKKLSDEIKEQAYPEMINRVKEQIINGKIKFTSSGEQDKQTTVGIEGTVKGSGLSKIFHEQLEEAKTELFEVLKQIMPQDKFPANKKYKNLFDDVMRRIWMDASIETQQKNPNMLDYILPLAQEYYEKQITKLTESINKFKTDYPEPEKLEEARNNTIKEREKERNTTNLNLLRGTKIKLTREHFQALIECSKEKGKLEGYEPDDLFDIYEQLFEYNANINSTINIDTLEIFGRQIDIMQLVRISANNIQLQENLIKIVSANTVTKQVVFDSINSSEYWDTEISAIGENYYSYRKLFENIEKQNVELSPKNIEDLKQIILQKNYFNIETMEDVKDYETIKISICQRILNGEELDKEYVDINKMNKAEREKFAILEMQYGISLKEAINIVQKYGKDIDEINDTEYADVIEQVRNLKNILEADDIVKLYEENKENLETVFGKAKYAPTRLDNECLNLYAKLYQQDLEEHSIDKNIKTASNILCDGQNITVVKISPYKMEDGKKKRGEISAFVRVEGAYADWKEPENFREALETPSVEYHGNCKSYIRSNNIAIARPRGPSYGYESCPKNTLKLMAPWDIVSTYGNTSLAINSLKWNEDVGIFSTKRIPGVQFRTPQNNINNTRHGHNEAVSERLVCDGKKFTKDEPNFVLFMTESGETIEEYETLLGEEGFDEKLQSALQKKEELTDEEYRVINAERWRVSKKAAMQLKKDIYIIDRDEFRECEEQRLQQLLDAFENPQKSIDFIEPDDSKLSETELLERIIIEFENNVVGNAFARNKGMFDRANREALCARIETRIDSLKKSNPVLYRKLSLKLEEVYELESRKSYSNTEQEVASPEFKEFYGEKTQNIRLAREHESGTEVQTLDFNEQGVQYSKKIQTAIEEINKTHLYDNCIEHIDKVILFAGVLAKNEGLDERTTNILIAASAFYDSGKKTREKKYSYLHYSEKSTLVAEDFFEKNPDNSFGIRQEDIGILKVAIVCQAVRDLERGEINKAEIKNACEIYGVSSEDFEKAAKVTELLKDADELDRTRFDNGRKMDTRNLRCQSAKKASMIEYAKKVNEELAREILIQGYGMQEEELVDANPIAQLSQKRKTEFGRIEKEVSVPRIIEIMQETRNHRTEPKTKNKMLMKLYNMFNVDIEGVREAKGILRVTLDKLKTIFQGRG